MAYRSNLADVIVREHRQRAYLAAPSIAARFPDAGPFAIELEFHDPTGALRPSPFRRIFAPSMQAFFEQPCPIHECGGGGYDLGEEISAMLTDKRRSRTGVARCAGSRAQKNGGDRCGLELRFRLVPVAPA